MIQDYFSLFSGRTTFSTTPSVGIRVPTLPHFYIIVTNQKVSEFRRVHSLNFVGKEHQLAQYLLRRLWLHESNSNWFFLYAQPLLSLSWKVRYLSEKTPIAPSASLQLARPLYAVDSDNALWTEAVTHSVNGRKRRVAVLKRFKPVFKSWRRRWRRSSERGLARGERNLTKYRSEGRQQSPGHWDACHDLWSLQESPQKGFLHL